MNGVDGGGIGGAVFTDSVVNLFVNGSAYTTFALVAGLGFPTGNTVNGLFGIQTTFPNLQDAIQIFVGGLP